MSMEEPLMGNPATGTLQTDRSDLGTSQTSANSYPHKTAMVGGRVSELATTRNERVFFFSSALPAPPPHTPTPNLARDPRPPDFR